MIQLPKACPLCEHEGISYSVGVIRIKTAPDLPQYPVVWCEKCHAAYFMRPLFTIWDRCSVNTRMMKFTDNPDKIDRSIKLEYDRKLIGHEVIYSVYPVLEDEIDVYPVLELED
jgi:hypothetical protein